MLDREDLDNGVDTAAVSAAADALQREAVRRAHDEEARAAERPGATFPPAVRQRPDLVGHSERAGLSSNEDLAMRKALSPSGDLAWRMASLPSAPLSGELTDKIRSARRGVAVARGEEGERARWASAREYLIHKKQRRALTGAPAQRRAQGVAATHSL